MRLRPTGTHFYAFGWTLTIAQALMICSWVQWGEMQMMLTMRCPSEVSFTNYLGTGEGWLRPECCALNEPRFYEPVNVQHQSIAYYAHFDSAHRQGAGQSFTRQQHSGSGSH